MILIVGSSRSGTTWLAKIFDSHPDVLYRHEPDSIRVEPGIPFIPPQDAVPRFTGLAARYLAELAEQRSIKVIGTVPLFPKSYRGALGSRLYGGLIYGLKALSRPAGNSDWVKTWRFPDLILKPGRKPHLVIKSVNSLSRSYLFSQADPTLKVIHIVRHPCGRIASLLRGIAQGKMGRPGHLPQIAGTEEGRARGLTLEAMAAMSLESQFAIHWMIQNDKAMTELAESPNYHLLRYEDLCAEPERITRELFDFAGLAWDPQSERFLQYSQGDDSQQRYFGIVRAPLKAANAWREQLAREQIEEIMEQVAQSPSGQLFLEPAESESATP